jgi:hypothetical protein
VFRFFFSLLPRCTMERWWKRDGTMMKTQWYVRWWYRDGAIVLCYIAFSPSYHRVFTIVPSRHRVFIIVPSRFHHRAIAFSQSYHCVFIIVPLRFDHRVIALSPYAWYLAYSIDMWSHIVGFYFRSVTHPLPVSRLS